MVKIKYCGVYPEVKWDGLTFKKGELVEYEITAAGLPFDIEVFNEDSDKKEFEDNEFGELLKIKGIGEETIEDIKRIFGSIKQLREALDKDKCPLRNDVCIKLKDYFIVVDKNGSN